jgi:uncharacterized membrane protein
MHYRTRMKPALLVILLLGIGGLAFSGYLTYGELFAETAASCPSPGAPGTVLGYPACVYGFFMYLAIVIAAAVGLARTRTRSA